MNRVFDDMVLRKKTGLRELALFAGAGGGILGGHLLGWQTVCAVEIEDWPRTCLLQRQLDGILPRFPVWDDIRSFDGHEWKGKVDVITGGFPCQDVSTAGRGKGITGERSGLWKEMARIVEEIKPRFVFAENTEMLINRGLDTVVDDLERQGYGGRAGLFPAFFKTGTQWRSRVFIRADATSDRWEWIWSCGQEAAIMESNRLGSEHFRHRADESGIVGVGYGIPNRVDRLKAIGNGQVPAVAAIAWEVLTNGNA